jgi:hypothetical protein
VPCTDWGSCLSVVEDMVDDSRGNGELSFLDLMMLKGFENEQRIIYRGMEIQSVRC